MSTICNTFAIGTPTPGLLGERLIGGGGYNTYYEFYLLLHLLEALDQGFCTKVYPRSLLDPLPIGLSESNPVI